MGLWLDRVTGRLDGPMFSFHFSLSSAVGCMSHQGGEAEYGTGELPRGTRSNSRSQSVLVMDHFKTKLHMPGRTSSAPLAK